MIQIQFLKPFYTKASNGILRLVFAYQYLSVTKDDEVFHFIPIEGKEMKIDLATKEVQNLSEVFVFQRGNRFLRLPLYQLILVSNIHDHLQPIIEKHKEENGYKKHKQDPPVINEEVLQFIELLEKKNIDRLIDEALEQKNEELFYKILEANKKNPV